VRAIPRKWINSKGINTDTERSEKFAMNKIRKEVGIFVQKPNKPKNNHKGNYNSKKR
jgi:hypothetical protein